MKNKSIFTAWLLAAALCFVLGGCATNPYTGKSTLALVGRKSLHEESFASYAEVMKAAQSYEETGTRNAMLVQTVSNKLRDAAEKWAAANGNSEYLEDYQWEYHLIRSDEVNAWCMPGGKIVVYTGILPVTKNADGLAAVLGHELAHALLNHGQQRQSAGMLQNIGVAAAQIGVTVAVAQDTKQNTNTAVQSGKAAGDVAALASTLFGTLPYSRSHETEADKIGQTLMIIAGYNGEEAAALWDRMAQLGGSGQSDFFSTHPASEKRAKALRQELPNSRKIAERVIASAR
ncbi:MAG: M48 family metallopeptidase [Spirochaetaceae bacterium]|jgi:predicted Zn-dependent protease|nr:M48 family metallopeptidase [Spirochaetaceae bacterium]GMO14790.1 MAG: M48 family metallopeptidase [Termitinemataceae bacterium]